MATRAVTALKTSKPEVLLIEERIRQRTQELYLERGGRDGSALDDWLQAEAEIRQAQGGEL